MDLRRPFPVCGRVLSAAAGAALVCFALAAPRLSAEGACERLRDLKLPHAAITRATAVRAGAAPFFTERAFCRIQATIVPTSDSDIKVEVWLPIHGWNGKFQAVGNADAAGVISYDAMVEAIRRGYATSSTDTGHVGNTLAFALGHREKYVDFGYRAVHEMTVKAKAIIARFYGTPASHAYWNGCSQGGRQGITEAIRYPADYDAIVAGAPAIEHMRLHAMRLALNMFVHRSGDSYIPPAKYQLIHRAALQACDRLDGLADGLIANPTRCHFDPVVLECPGADGPSCLTEVEVETARAMYTPIVLPSTGRIVLPALLQPGSELGWARLGGAQPLVNAIEPFKYVVFKNANWDWHAFHLATDLPLAIRADEGVIDRTDPDLEPFFDAGGKLLMYHGWSDPQVPALDTIGYFNAVLKTTAEARRGTSIELYMEPGVSHCFGGDGPDTFDAVGALDQWVRTGRAPSRIVAAMSGGDVARTRPLCRYPEIAKYVGSGSIDDASSFRCTTDAAPALRTASIK